MVMDGTMARDRVVLGDRDTARDGRQRKGKGMAEQIADVDLTAVSVRLEELGAKETIRWTADRFGADCALACSFQDPVILDLLSKVAPRMEVIFLDTGFHFPETIEYVARLQRRYDLNLRVVRPGPDADPWPCGSSECCQRRKVAPLLGALCGRAAWLTGLKRCDAPTRAKAPVVSWDSRRKLVKVNPMAAWTEVDVSAYMAQHDLPPHPLTAQGYLSIGCAPTTSPVAPGADHRSGRWSGSDKTECGLHE